MKGILKDSPGSCLIALIWPNCSTSAFSRSSTTKIDDRPRNTATTTSGIKNLILPMISVSFVCRGVAAQLVQRQVGDHAAAALGADDGLVEDRLVDIAQHLLHPFEIEAFARDLGGLVYSV